METEKPDAKVQNQKSKLSNSGQNLKPAKLSEVKHIETSRLKSGFAEFDRVTGGGIVPGSVTLVAGDPGIGKSTLLLHVLGATGGLYVTGEESNEQVKLRAVRLGINGNKILVMAQTDINIIAASLESLTPAPVLVIIDSIQTIASTELVGMAGSVGQIRYAAEQLICIAKKSNIPIFIIGHVTKEGMIAGPKVLEHMVDCVLYLEGERYACARILRTLKNRFGAVEEVGIFEMGDKGLVEIDNPSRIFLEDRVRNVPGSIVTVIMEGTRPILVEIQALAVPTQLAIPRRVGSGVDYNRLQLLVAVLAKRLQIPTGNFDIFINVSGGLKVEEPSCDLAIIMAIYSSIKGVALDDKTAVFGEVGLLGEIRRVSALERRSREAHRLGFSCVISGDNLKNVQQLPKYFP